jgi:hypothetical protein
MLKNRFVRCNLTCDDVVEPGKQQQQQSYYASNIVASIFIAAIALANSPSCLSFSASTADVIGLSSGVLDC